MNTLLGANWRTTLSGWITVLASAIAINPGIVAFLPETLRSYVTGIAGLVAIVSGGTFAYNAKDKQVTGSSTGTGGTGPVLPVILLVGVLALSAGCATFRRWQANPKVQTAEQIALQVVESSALNAGLGAIEQLTTTGGVDGRTVAAGALNGAAYELRTLESTSSAADPVAVASAVNNGTGNTVVAQAVAPVVSSAVQTAVQQGASPDAAVETAATALDTAAAQGGK